MMTTIPSAGHVLGERYRLNGLIASGGMGDVWRATDELLDREVAVKVLRHGPATDEPGFLERFRDEARHSASLHHPNIAAVYDYGEDGSGRAVTPYIVMELVPGQPLSAVIRARGPMPPGDVRGIVGQAALALEAAHGAGVVHRDVKPANIIVTPSGQAKLTDFGISRVAGSGGHTMTGEVLGTPEYLSPEQALGEQATAASDLYALGIIAHEMLMGRKPFEGATPIATAYAQVNDAPPPLPDTVPAPLRSVVDACLLKDATARPSSARAVADALMTETPISTTSSDPTAHLRTPATVWTAGAVEMGAGAAAEAQRPAEAPVAATRALPPIAPTPRESQPRAATRAQRHTSPAEPRRKLAWLAVPAVAVALWAAFALGSMFLDEPAGTPGGAPTTPVAQHPTTGGTMSTAPTSPSTTTPPTTTETTDAAPTTDPQESHPGKGKGKKK